MIIPDFCAELNNFLESSGVSQSALGKQTGVPQSQISSWTKGRLKRFGKNPKKVMIFIENYRSSKLEPIPNNVLQAVRIFCAGSKERSDILVKIITDLHLLN
jgi:predicted transcriptional regulator